MASPPSVMTRAPISPSALLPLLQGSWRGDRAAWDCLLPHLSAVRAATTAVWRTVPAALRARLEDGGYEDLVSETLASMMRRARDHEGLARPEDWDGRADAFPWLYKVAWTHAATVARTLRRVGAREIPDTDETGERRHEEKIEPDPAAQVDAARQKQELMTLLEQPDLKPAHKLVIVVRSFPDLLTADLVVEVAGASDGGRGWGLARPPEETGELLQGWVARVGGRGEVDANRELAWILRSTDRTSPERWRREHPDEMAKALDLLRQWRNRALHHLGGAR